MAKRKKTEVSGFTMSALIRQVLLDGKAHDKEEIAAHVQNYMCKTIPLSTFALMIEKVLLQDAEIEKTKKGYKLKSGESIRDLVTELIATANAPLQMKDIVKLVAKKQKLPVETVKVEIDDDKRFAQVVYKNKKYYYLASRKKVNSKVYEILKAKNRAMTYTEIFKALESEYGLKKDKVIFLPREDPKFRCWPGLKFSLRSVKAKKKPAEPIHNVTRAELDRVVEFLKVNEQAFTASELSEKVIKKPLKNTNLLIKINRDSRLKREGDKFYCEIVEEPVEIPQKIRDRVSGDYFKVKARLVGSQDVQTTEQLLDRIYKVNISHQEYAFYEELLVEQLMHDEGVVRTNRGWLKVDADIRTKWEWPDNFNPIILPENLERPTESDLNARELQFLNEYRDEVLENEIKHYITAKERFPGIMRIPDQARRIFEQVPQYTEITLIDEDNYTEFNVFLNQRRVVLLEMNDLYEAKIPSSEALIRIKPVPDDVFRYYFSIEFPRQDDLLDAESFRELAALASKNQELFELLRLIFKRHAEEKLEIQRIWTELTAVGEIERIDLLAALHDFKCFVPDEKEVGWYQYDASKGDARYSVKSEKQMEPVAQAVESGEKPAVSEPVPDEKVDKKEPEKVPVAEPKEKAAVKAPVPEAPRKKVRRRKSRVEEAEQVPDHIKRLKSMGKKLPRIGRIRSMVVKSGGDEPGAKIGAVSVGRITHARDRGRAKKSTVEKPLELLPVPPTPAEPQTWETSSFVNADRSAGHAELFQSLEVLKAFINRAPQIRKSDGSVVIWLNDNNISIYFRVPPENPNCWLAWIPEGDIRNVSGANVFLTEGSAKAKLSQNGYWWCTQKFKGPRGNWKDRNVLEGFQIIGKILELMDKVRK